ncbi:MAG: TonB-dependent receptor plug domain-containing protein [Gemmatimonadales bacterium]|nr:TonB-dependent receptor plug domain-containing protein [Gemmatimonadales bacterium]
MSVVPGRVAVALMLAVPAALAAQDSLPDSAARASPVSLSAFTLQRLPIDDPRHALPLVPGVVLRVGDVGIDTRPVLVIRGGRGAANVYVDGASLRFQTRSAPGLALPISAIDHVTVITGVAPVELADAAGGALWYETRRGGARWNGAARWDSDEPFGSSSTVGYNRIEADVGGPLGGRARVFVTAGVQGQRSAYRGPGAAAVPTYVPAGFDTTVTDGGGAQVTLPLLAQWSGACDAGANSGVECQGLRRPFDWNSARRVQARMEWPYGSASGISVTGIGIEMQRRDFPGTDILNPALYAGRRAWSAAAIVNWRHALGALRGWPVRLETNIALVRHGERGGPLEPDAELATRDPALGVAFESLRFLGADSMDLPVSNALIRDVRTNSGTRGVPFFGNANQVGQAHRGNPYGLSSAGWWTSGLDGTLTDVAERRVAIRSALIWSLGRHTVTIGVDGERSRIAAYSSNLLRQVDLDVFAARPTRIALLAGDRFWVDDRTVLDAAVRYDRFDPGGELPNTPLFVSSSGPALWNPLSATDDTAYANSVERVFHPASVNGIVSARLRLQYAIRRNVDFHLAYVRAAEPPPWGTLFAHANSDLSFTNTGDMVGTDVRFAVPWLFELGLRSPLGGRTRLDVRAYWRDLPRYEGRFRQFSDPRDPTRVLTINALSLVENRRGTGLDLGIDWRAGRLGLQGAYSLARTAADGEPGVLPRIASVTSHALALMVDLALPEGNAITQGMNAVLLARAQSGDAYTRLENEGRGILTFELGGVPAEDRDASRISWTTRLDLQIAKSVRVAGRDWSVYLDARNVVNARNLMALFAETGATTNDRHRLQTIGDPTLPTGQYAILRDEAQNAGALEPDGTTVNLTACSVWGNPVNCVALTRVERRFGDGDRLYTLAEQQAAFNAYYDDFFGAWRFYGSGRTLRVGVRLGF